MSTTTPSPTSAASPGVGGPALAPNWKATKDANGQVYYYNRVTRETRWDPPLAQSAPLATTTGAPAPVPIQSLPHNAPSSTAGSVAAASPAAQAAAKPLSRNESREGSPSLSRANPSVTERVATLSRSSASQSQLDSSAAVHLNAAAGGTAALPPPPPDLPEAGTARKRVADLAQAFTQKTSSPGTPASQQGGSKGPASAPGRKWAGSNNQLADPGKRGSVYSVISEPSSNDVGSTAAAHVSAAPDAQKTPPLTTVSAAESSAPPVLFPPPVTADPAPTHAPDPVAIESNPPPATQPPPLDAVADPSPSAPPCVQLPSPALPLPPPTATLSTDPPSHHGPHPRTYSVSHAHSAASTAPSQMHPRSMTISSGSGPPSRLPAFPLAPIETTTENDDDRPLQRTKPPSPKKLRESTMSGFLVDLDQKLANSQGNLIVALSQAAAAASQSEQEPDVAGHVNHRASGVPSLSIAPPTTAEPSTPGGSSHGPNSSPISPSTSTHSTESPSHGDSVGEHSGTAKEGGLGGLLRRARSPSFSKPNKKEKSSKDKSKHTSGIDDSFDQLSLSQPDSPNLQSRSPTSLADHTKPDKVRPKSLVLGSLGIGTASSSGSGGTDHANNTSASTQSLSSSSPSIAGSATTPNNSPASGTTASASSSGGKGAFSRLFKKSDKSSSSSASANASPTSPDTAAQVFGGSLSVLGAAGVPPLVTLCMGIVEERGPRIEGIYRLSGNAAAIQRHKAAWQQVATAAPGTPLPDVAAFDVNVVSGTLKCFLRELQDPVLTCDMYPEWVLAGKMDPGPSRADVIRGLIARLPLAHQDVLRVLMWHLHGLSKYADHTKMDPSNLAIVFGPTLVRPRVESMETMVNTEPQNAVVAEMIANVGDYFAPLEADGGDECAPASPVRDSGETAEPASPSAKFRPPKGAMLVMPLSPMGLPPKLPDLHPISPMDTPENGSREGVGQGGIGI